VIERAVPSLTSDALALRPWRNDEADVATVLLASTDAAVTRYSPSISKVSSVEDARAWLAARTEPDRIDWAIEVEYQTVGRVGLAWIRDETSEAEIGYWLLPQARGRGTLTSAVRLMTAWAFGSGGFGRLEIRHLLDNDASCKVAERCGFLVEGVQRGALEDKTGRHDLHLHGKLATDPA
jgi:RimJ/RimL family protein N-acetyltransferase